MDHSQVKSAPKLRSPKSRLENVRSSCDNCTKSKVRCSKNQPRCQRCIHQGVHCKYSLSRKCRRRTTSTVESISGSNQPLESSRERPSRFEDGLSTLLPSNPASICDIASFTPSVAEESSNQLYEDGVRSNDSNYGDYEMLSPFGTNVDSLMDWGESMVSLDQAMLRQDLSLAHHDMSTCWPLPSHGSADSLREKLPLSRRHSSPNENCSHLAISAVQSLEAPFASCSLTSFDEAIASSPGMARGLDTVIKINRAAIDTTLTILDCSCSRQEDLIFLIATICLRALSWYQASLDSGSSNGSPSIASGCLSASFTASSSVSGSTSTLDVPPSMDWVSIPAINFGFYALDEEHSSCMVAQLICAELSKIKSVVDKFSSKYCERDSAISTLYSAKAGENNTQFYVELEALLRDRLDRTIVSAREHIERW